MTTTSPLSIFIITKNEAKRLPGCLEIVKDFADEIIILDSGSTDETEAIAKRYGAHFAFREFDGFGQQKFAAEQMCKNDWVLNLDADEYLTESAIQEIKTFLADEAMKQNYDGARLKTVTVYPGKQKPRLWADYHNYIRLYNKQKLNYPLHPTHDAIDVVSDDRILHLKGIANHFAYESISALESKTRDRTKFYFKQEKRGSYLKNYIRVIIEYPFAFFKCYILRRHITGGLTGIRVSHIYAKYRFIRILQRVLNRCILL